MDIPIIGQKYGDWEVIGTDIQKYKRWYMYNVKCTCGYTKYVASSTLKSNKSTCCRKCSTNKKFKGFENISSTFFSRIKESATKRNIEFNITIEYINNLLINQNFKCILSDLPIIMSKSYAVDRSSKISNTTASLDRIDSKIGYIESNLQWIHKDINYMKNKYDQDYFIQMCKLIANKQ